MVLGDGRVCWYHRRLDWNSKTHKFLKSLIKEILKLRVSEFLLLQLALTRHVEIVVFVTPVESFSVTLCAARIVKKCRVR